MRRASLLIIATTLLTSCERASDPPAPTPPTPPPLAEPDLPPPAPEPWRLPGELLGATDTHAIVLTDDIVSVDIATGEVRARAVTEAEDPVPSFDRHLPRLGVDSREAQPVDRLTELPTYVGGEVVVFMRGSKEVVTSLVGLDTTTLEEAWTLEVAYRRPIRSCTTENGVLLIPQAPQPARFVDWLGQQAWLREFGKGELQDVRCGIDRVQVRMKTTRGYALRSYDSGNGDLINKASAEADSPWTVELFKPAVHGVEQVGPEVIQVTSRN